MKEIVVPQELKEKIIDLYVNKQYGRERIIKELNLPFGDMTLKNFLKQNNIHIRNFQESKKGSPKLSIPKELQEQIIEAYNQGYGLNKIVEQLHLNFSFDKVRSILEENGVPLRTLEEAAAVRIMPDLRKYSINDNYNFLNHNGAWILGFLAADGYLPKTKGAKNRIVITLQRRDEEVLSLIANELSFTGPIFQFITNNGHEASSIAFNSKKIREEVEKYGIVNNKTFKIKCFPDLPEEFLIDYIKGYFDGDGSLYEPKGKRINMNFTSANKEFLEVLSTFLSEKYGLSKPRINSVIRVNEIYEIKYYVKDSLILGDLFYNNNYLSLPRKKEHYFNIIRKKPPTSLDTPQG